MSKRRLAVALIVVLAAVAGGLLYRARATHDLAGVPPPQKELPARLNNLLQTHRVRQPDAVTDEDRAGVSAREKELLDRAYAALDAGVPDDALVALNTWRLEVRHSPRTEEVEILRIKTMLVAGRPDDAKEYVRQFEIKHPNSPLLPNVKKLVSP